MTADHPAKHELLHHYHKLSSQWQEELAAYHWNKAHEPISDLELPIKPNALNYFINGNYHGFCGLLDLPCPDTCAMCLKDK